MSAARKGSFVTWLFRVVPAPFYERKHEKHMLQNITDLLIIFILISLSAFFSSSETALTAVNRIRMKALADEGSKKAAAVLEIIDNRPKMLSTILIGNNLVNISLTAFSTTTAIRLFGSSFVGAATGILTAVIVIFGEITPKTAAAIESEKLSLRCAGVIRFLMKIFTPLIFLSTKVSRFLIRLMGIDPDARVAMTENELRALVDVSEEDGVIETDERNMINNVVDLQDTYAKEIMIPRIDVTSVPVTCLFDDLVELFRTHRFTRMPVYEDRQENVIGILNVKDLLVTGREHFDMRKTMQAPYFTYEMKNISDLLDEMQDNSLSIVIVLDEYGNASGLITLEDVLEEIVGDLHDEYKGRDAEEITTIAEGREYSCIGSADIDDINKATGLKLMSEHYDSIGGFVIEHSDDKLPKVGEYVYLDDGTRLVVEAVRKNRIMRVHIYLPEE